MAFEDLIARLDRAVQGGEVHVITSRLKHELETLTRQGDIKLPARFHAVKPAGYARRLLHRDERLGYTAIVMTWGPGQGTALHDHAGIWCVEGVVEGRMEVTRFDLVDESNGTYAFDQKDRIVASVGSAGSLIPPFEYHVLANAQADRPSMTLHVYGGEMTSCHVFERRADGRYERRTRTLGYDE
jgi:predicted metal-dependent enzyme (double-stranded beta helix superfamily)